jgi:hypothetical protein
MNTYNSRGYEYRPARVQWFARLPRTAQNLLVAFVMIAAFAIPAWLDDPTPPAPTPAVDPYSYYLHPEYERR